MDARIRLLALGVSTLLLAPAASPRAATPGQMPPLTPEQAASLDQAVRLWTNIPAGRRSDATDDYTVTPERDGYRVSAVAMPTLSGGMGKLIVTGGGVTAIARPLTGGRWTFDAIRMTAPLVMAGTGGPGGGPIRISVTPSGEAGHVLIDPSLKTQSTFDTEAASAEIHVSAPGRADATVRLGHQSTAQVWLPVGQGRFDDFTRGELDDLSASIGDKAPADRLDVAVHQLTSTWTARSVSLAGLADLIVTLRDEFPAAIAPAAPARPGPSSGAAKPVTKIAATLPLPPAGRAVLRRAVGEMRDLASSVDVGVTADVMTAAIGGHRVDLRHAALSGGVGAPGGLADLHLRLEVDGLSSPDMPPAVAEFLPRHFVLAPRLTGIRANAVFGLLLRLLSDPPPSAAERNAASLALLGNGGASLRLDEVAFSSGPASLQAAGALQVAGPSASDVSGSAEIEVRNYDAFLRSAATNPLLKRAIPMLIFMKGIGDEHDGVTRWHITYLNGKLLVNGTDLSALGH